MAEILPNAKTQFLDFNGKPLAGGSVYFYVPNTTTLKNTYQDQAQTILNTNPVVLDANGQAIIWGTGSYRQVVYDSASNLIWDQVTENPNTSVSADLSQFEANLAASSGSTLVGFIQSGTGAVVRVVQDKLRETVHVADFGAVGDGATDDTAAIQNAAAYIRSLGGGRLVLGNNKTYKVLPAGTGLNLLDFTNCNGVTVDGNGSTISTGNVTTTIIGILLNATSNVIIRNLKFISANNTLTGTNGMQWIVANNGANNILMQNIGFTYGVVGFAAQGAIQNAGSDSNRVRNIVMLNMSSLSCYYPLNFQGAGDNFFGRGITTRNAGRSYFPYNVHDHDIEIDSQQGGPFSDVLLKVYGSTAWYSRLENIRVVYYTTGRFSGSGNQSVDEAMISMDFQLNSTNPAPCSFQNIDITFNVDASNTDKNQSIFAIRKYDSAGNADSTGSRGHALLGLKLRGQGRNLSNLLADGMRFFSRSPDNWTGEDLENITLEDATLAGVNTQNTVTINGQGIQAPLRLKGVSSAGNLSQSNTSGKQIYFEEVAFANFLAFQKPFSFTTSWTAATTNPAIGNGTLNAVYTLKGRVCTVDVYMQAGSTTTFGSGQWSFSLPFNSTTGVPDNIGSAAALDSTVSFYTGVCINVSGTNTVSLLLGGNPGAFANALSPWTWKSGDYLKLQISFPIA